MKNLALLAVIAGSVVLGGALVNYNVFPGNYLKAAMNRIKPAQVATGPKRYTGATVAAQKDQSTPGDTSSQGILQQPLAWKSKHLQDTINIPAGVFEPNEAEWSAGPLITNNGSLFDGKRVMEIGTGSGIISLLAAKQGAAKVVATDINPKALESVTTNAKDLGYGDVVDARLVTLDDISAYAVIEEDEKFDVIISNPPFALDLDAPGNDAVTDTGELGFSIVNGLEDHLADGGIVILMYDSLFYHHVMVKYAEYKGYEVRSNSPNGMYGWAAEVLFNGYLKRLLEREGLPEDAISFNYYTDEALQIRYLRNFKLEPEVTGYQALFDAPSPRRYYPGWLVIRNKES